MTNAASRRGPWWAAPDPSDLGVDRTCAICGTGLGADTDDDPGATAGSICGDCARAREFDQTLWEQDLAEPDSGLW